MNFDDIKSMEISFRIRLGADQEGKYSCYNSELCIESLEDMYNIKNGYDFVDKFLRRNNFNDSVNDIETEHVQYMVSIFLITEDAGMLYLVMYHENGGVLIDYKSIITSKSDMIQGINQTLLNEPLTISDIKKLKVIHDTGIKSSVYDEYREELTNITDYSSVLSSLIQETSDDIIKYNLSLCLKNVIEKREINNEKNMKKETINKHI